MKIQHRRSGITFVEMMVSIPTATILIGAMATCITITMRTKSQDENIFRTTYGLANVATQIATDLESATAHVSSSATRIEFVVPDRNGDGLPEQMRYEWGGATGSNANKILWKYNDQPTTVLFDDVGSFSIQRNMSTAPATVPNHLRSETAVLKSINAFPGNTFREHIVNANNPIGQYFIPDTTATGGPWDLGSVRIMVRAADSNTDGILRVRIMRSDSTRLPILPILAEVNIEESRLGTTYQWLDVPIAPVSWQSPGTPLCITLSYGGGTGNIARVQYIENGAGMPTNANLVTAVGGATWTVSAGTVGLRFYAYGLNGNALVQRTFLTSVDLRLGSASNTTRRIETSVRLKSVPEIP